MKLTRYEVALLRLLGSIREAAGDPEGKLMQDELVDHIRAMREELERLSELVCEQDHEVIMAILDRPPAPKSVSKKL